MFGQHVKWLACLTMMAVALCAGNKKDTPIGVAGDEWVEIKADIYSTLEEVHNAVGADVPPGIVAVKVSIKPRGNEKLKLNVEDFQLLSYHDGQKSGPYTPTQIAGNTTIQLKKGQMSTIGIGQVSNGPSWGGLGGSRPREMPGKGGGVGNAGGVSTGVEAGKVEEAKGDEGKPKKDSTLLMALKDKQLKGGEIRDWEMGLLYFPLEGKQKLKDLVLIYKSPAGKLVLAFGR